MLFDGKRGRIIVQYKDVEKGKKKDTTSIPDIVDALFECIETVEQKKHPQQEKVRANV